MICKSCGKITFQETNTCSHCGKAITNEATSTNSNAAEQKSKHPVLKAMAGLVALGIVIGILSSTPDNSSTQPANAQTANSTTQSKEPEKAVAKTETEYKVQHEETLGVLELKDGRNIEYFSASPSLLCYELDSYTTVQMEQFNKTFIGQNVYFYGEITDIYDDGSVSIHCIDKEESDRLGLSWPLMASVCLHTNESKDLLMKLSQGDEVIAMGTIHEKSYSSLLGVKCLDLVSGELIFTPYSTRLPN